MLTIEVIMKDAATINFAKHFATKTSIKNLLKQVPNAQKISVLFEDEKYGDELLGYGTLEVDLDIVLIDVFKAYTAQVADWRSTGDNRNTAARVSLFKDLLADRIEKKDFNNGLRSTGQRIVDNLADFLKTVTGKEIEGILTDAGVSNDGKDSLRMDIITWVAVRAFINKEMLPRKRVNGEIVKPKIVFHDSASHTIIVPKVKNDYDGDSETSVTAPSGKTYDIIHTRKPDNGNGIIVDLIGEFKNLLESEHDMTRLVDIVKSQIPMITELINKHMDSVIGCDERLVLTNANAKAVLGDYCTLDKLRIVKRIDAVKFLAYIISTRVSHSDDENLLSRILFYTVVDVINNPDNDKVIADGIDLFKSLLVPAGTSVSSVIRHVGRLDEVVARNFTQVITPRKDEDNAIVAPLTREEIRADVRKAFSPIFKLHRGGYAN